jgi:hypothetical protein
VEHRELHSATEDLLLRSLLKAIARLGIFFELYTIFFNVFFFFFKSLFRCTSSSESFFDAKVMSSFLHHTCNSYAIPRHIYEYNNKGKTVVLTGILQTADLMLHTATLCVRGEWAHEVIREV